MDKAPPCLQLSWKGGCDRAEAPAGEGEVKQQPAPPGPGPAPAGKKRAEQVSKDGVLSHIPAPHTRSPPCEAGSTQ